MNTRNKLKNLLIKLEKGVLFIRKIPKYLARKCSIDNQPLLYIEVTNICNSKCIFCPNQIMKRPRQHMDMELFKKVVDEFLAIGGTKLSFNVCVGEPLLDPYILERAKYVRNNPQIKTLGFNTTLQWLHKINLNEFLDSGITWLCISTMLLGKKKYAEFFGVDNYDQTLLNIVSLLEENRKRKNPIAILSTLKPSGDSSEDVNNHPDYKMVDNLLEGNLDKETAKTGFYVDDWNGNVTLPRYMHKRPIIPRLFRPCKFIYKSLMIFSNGKAGLCPCRDFEANSELILGDTNTTPLKELWNNKNHIRLINNWSKKNIVPEICKKCTQYCL